MAHVYPTDLKLVKDGDAVKGTWSNPADALWDSNPSRWSGVDIYIYSQASKNMATSGWKESRADARYVTGDRVWVRDLGVASEHSQPFDPSKYHPKVSGRYLTSMDWDLWAMCADGANLHVKANFKFEVPKTPKFSDIEYDSTEKKLSATLTAFDEGDAADFRDLQYRVLRTDNFNSAYSSEKVVQNWQTAVDYSGHEVTEIDVEYDVADANAITRGQWIRIRFEAYARGVRGDSAHVFAEHVIAYPAIAAITAVRISDVNASSGIVNVLLNTNHKASSAPVDTVKLQVLRNSTRPTVESAKLDSGWEDVDNAVDNENCKGLVDSVITSVPSRGHYTYYRLVTSHDNLTSISEPVKAEALSTASRPVDDDDVAIYDIESGEDGTSIHIVLAWKDDDSNGTEVSWSDNPTAWESNEQPTTYNVTWEDDTSQASGFAHSASFYIRGLEEGKKYYIKARRYAEEESEITYSPIYVTPPSEKYPIAPYTTPANVVLLAPSYVKKGSDVDFSWAFDSDSVQKEWILYSVTEDSKTAVANGTDSLGSTSLTAEVLDGLAETTGSNALKFSVSLSTGGNWADSSDISVEIQEPPSFAIAADTVLKAQPLQFYVKSSSSDTSMIVKVISKGISSQDPDKSVTQLEGDCVYSDSVEPDWIPVDGAYAAVIALPTTVDFRSNGGYQLQLTALDKVTGLKSEEMYWDFDVDWTSKALVPGRDPIISVDREEMAVSITPSANVDGNETDYLDVYRITPSGASCIASSLDFGATVVDKYAPFSKVVPLQYRIVTRTMDGDLEWTDVSYDFRGYQMRFDWAENQYLELPYNPEISDSYAKDFESRSYIDGTVSGVWNSAISHKSSLKTKILRLSDPEQIVKVVDLANYAGPVFVRLPNGSAFTANVVVTSMDNNFKDQVISVSISAEEIGLVDAFRVDPANVSYPSEFIPPDRSEEYTRQQILKWDDVKPQEGDELSLNEEPSGTIRVTLESSQDNYALRFIVPAIRTGTTVTLDEFPQSLIGYIDSAPSGTVFLLKAFYNV